MRRILLGLVASLCLNVPSHSTPLTEARVVPLKGVTNSRELGGIPVPGGHVREGWVFLTNALYQLTDADVQQLKDKGIRSVIDFRLEPDHSVKPDRQDFVKTLAYVYWFPMDVHTTPKGYREMPDLYPNQIRDLFRVFADKDCYPLIYHCAEGKDRTGIATALLLELLGVDRKLILEDYMASKENGPRFYVQADWIEGLLAGVDAAGGIETYLQQHGIPRSQQQAIRELLIVPDP